MRTKALYFILFILGTLLTVSFSDPYLIKRVSDKEYRYEFYTTSKKVKPKKDKMYSWFKGGLIHNAQSGIAGELLNDEFVKTYHSNQLAQSGFFKNGLKVGIWKNWYENGKISSIEKWKSGIKSGTFISFNDKGEITEKGKFKNDKKEGIWINYLKQDTIFYKKGNVFIKKKKPTKEEKLKEENNSSKEIEKLKKKEKKNTKPSQDKESFFKRLFSKKSKDGKSE